MHVGQFVLVQWGWSPNETPNLLNVFKIIPGHKLGSRADARLQAVLHKKCPCKIKLLVHFRERVGEIYEQKSHGTVNVVSDSKMTTSFPFTTWTIPSSNPNKEKPRQIRHEFFFVGFKHVVQLSRSLAHSYRTIREVRILTLLSSVFLELSHGVRNFPRNARPSLGRVSYFG